MCIYVENYIIICLTYIWKTLFCSPLNFKYTNTFPAWWSCWSIYLPSSSSSSSVFPQLSRPVCTCVRVYVVIMTVLHDHCNRRLPFAVFWTPRSMTSTDAASSPTSRRAYALHMVHNRLNKSFAKRGIRCYLRRRRRRRERRTRGCLYTGRVGYTRRKQWLCFC